MDGIQILAMVLLVGRLIAVNFLSRVLAMQVKLLRLPIDPAVWDFRRKLHYMTISLMVVNLPSIILDFAVIMGVDRTTPYLVVYAFSNMVGMVIAAITIDQMYELAKNTNEVNELEKKHVERQHDKELKNKR